MPQGRRQSFIEMVRELHAQGKPLSYETIPSLVLAARQDGTIPCPNLFKQFLKSFLARKSFRLAVDPFAGIGESTHALLSTATVRETLAITSRSELREVAVLLGHPTSTRWEVGDPSAILNQLPTDIDLAVSCPPWGVHRPKTKFTAGDKALEVSDDWGHLVLLETCNRLSANGLGIFLLSNSFFLTRHGVRALLPRLGLRIKAALGLPPGIFSPMTSVSANIVIIERGQPEDIYFAELNTERHIGTVIDHLASSEIAKPRYGMTVKADSRIDPRSALQGYDLQKRLLDQGLTPVAIGDVAEIRRGKATNNGGFTDTPNSIFLPLIGMSDVVTNLADLKLKPHNYAQLILREDVASAECVAVLLNSEIGHLMRKSLFSGVVIPHVSLQSLRAGTLYLPPLSKQTEIVRAHTQLAALKSQVNEISLVSWKSPANVKRLKDELQPFSEVHSFDYWIEKLPFPLASILWTYHAAQEPHYKKGHLFHFFEALAQYNATLLLSAFSSDQAFYLASCS